MKILILDDQQSRHDGFSKIFINDQVDHAYNLKQFESLVNANSPYDIIFFDHDLGEETPVGQNPLAASQTGMDAVKYVVAASPRWPRQAVVHSVNPPAAARMVTALRDAGIPATYQPFRT